MITATLPALAIEEGEEISNVFKRQQTLAAVRNETRLAFFSSALLTSCFSQDETCDPCLARTSRSVHVNQEVLFDNINVSYSNLFSIFLVRRLNP